MGPQTVPRQAGILRGQCRLMTAGGDSRTKASYHLLDSLLLSRKDTVLVGEAVCPWIWVAWDRHVPIDVTGLADLHSQWRIALSAEKQEPRDIRRSMNSRMYSWGQAEPAFLR
jgi:hypothetical protein